MIIICYQFVFLREGNFINFALGDLYGFIECCVKCPEHINKPFLPYRTDTGVLIYPTGEFLGVFYSEELKYAQSIGYTIISLRGYLYEKGFGVFDSVVKHIYVLE